MKQKKKTNHITNQFALCIGTAKSKEHFELAINNNKKNRVKRQCDVNAATATKCAFCSFSPHIKGRALETGYER